MSAYPVLIGDIGGTNARFAVADGPAVAPRELARLSTADYASPVEAIRVALEKAPELHPRSMMLAVAGAVAGPVVEMTNTGWTCDAAALRQAFGLESVTLMNDFVPVAASLEAPDSLAGAVTRIGRDIPLGDGPKLVLGAGTGLGAAALVPVGEILRIVSTEAGHVDLGAANAAEATLFPHCANATSRLTAETLLSGPGLVRLNGAIRIRDGLPPLDRSASEVTEAAFRGEPDAEETIERFAAILGRYAGDLALLFGARGGVYLAGGIAPRIAAALQRHFRAAFENKAPLDSLVKAIPTYLMADPDPALVGLTVLAGRPDRFVYDHARAT